MRTMQEALYTGLTPKIVLTFQEPINPIRLKPQRLEIVLNTAPLIDTGMRLIIYCIDVFIFKNWSVTLYQSFIGHLLLCVCLHASLVVPCDSELCQMGWYAPMPIINGSVVYRIKVVSNGQGLNVPENRYVCVCVNVTGIQCPYG